MPSAKTNIAVMEDDTIEYTQDELKAIKETRDLLFDLKFCNEQKLSECMKEEEISLRHLALTVILTKCRPQEAAVKYVRWMEYFRSNFDISYFSERQLTLSDNPAELNESNEYLHSYVLAGKDMYQTEIFWINSGGSKPIPNDKEQEKLAILAALRYHMALHADPKTLREGITFVLDVTNKPEKKVGNERKMQGAWNIFPLRPRSIFIVGASKFFRISFNLLIKVASVVTNMKVIKRIKFVERDQLLVGSNQGGTVPETSLPKYLKDDKQNRSDELTEKVSKMKLDESGEINPHSIFDDDKSIIEWVNKRISNFPVPDLN